MIKENRYVITGIGLASPIGNNLSEHREGLLNQKSGITHDEIRHMGKVAMGKCSFDELRYQKKKMRRRGTRAGAIAISELLFFQKAMILIPFPSAAENHQNFNANYIINKKACKKIDQKELLSGILELSVKEILEDNNQIKALENNAKNISKPYATKKIVYDILESIS